MQYIILSILHHAHLASCTLGIMYYIISILRHAVKTSQAPGHDAAITDMHLRIMHQKLQALRHRVEQGLRMLVGSL